METDLRADEPANAELERYNRLKREARAEAQRIKRWQKQKPTPLVQPSALRGAVAGPAERKPRGRKAGPVDKVVGRLLAGAKKRAQEKGLLFTLRPEDVRIPTFCPVLGLRLAAQVGKAGDNSPTLDRVDPKYGYTKGNVVVMSHRANRLKADATAKELRLVLNWLVEVRKW